MEDDEVVLLPLLNGTNFASWKYRMLILLEGKGLSECIQKERKDGDDLRLEIDKPRSSRYRENRV